MPATSGDGPILYDAGDGVAWIRLNRPHAQNTLTPQLIEDLDGALRHAEADPAVRVLVITGTGPAFCAGADLTTIGDLGTYATRARFAERMAYTGSVFRRVESLPMPVIGAVNGLTRAGGLELLLCCDLVIAARTALLGEGHAPHGQLPGGGASVRLPRKIGPTRAKYLLFSGALVPAQTFYEWGAMNEVVDDDRLLPRARELADLLAANSPESIRRMKRLVDDGLAQPADAALRLEILTAEVHLGSDDMGEGMAAFDEGRPPRFGPP